MQANGQDGSSGDGNGDADNGGHENGALLDGSTDDDVTGAGRAAASSSESRADKPSPLLLDDDNTTISNSSSYRPGLGMKSDEARVDDFVDNFARGVARTSCASKSQNSVENKNKNHQAKNQSGVQSNENYNASKSTKLSIEIDQQRQQRRSSHKILQQNQPKNASPKIKQNQSQLIKTTAPQRRLSTSQSLRNLHRQSSQSFRHLRRNLRHQSSIIVDSIQSNLPTSPTGWALLATTSASLVLQYELSLQKSLTAPPHVFCQVANSNFDGNGGSGSTYGGGGMNGKIERLYKKLTTPDASDDRNSHSNNVNNIANNHNSNNLLKQKQKEGIFTRNITPSLFIGSRGLFSSTAAYAMGDKTHQKRHPVRRCREIMKMGADGAHIALDWEIPLLDDPNNNAPTNNNTNATNKIDEGPPQSIDKPLMLLLHGMNNDSSFGYIRSMMRTATSRGWIACAMNMRGQGGVKLNTPRAYNAGYTGDVRGVVLQLEKRLVRRNQNDGDDDDDDDMYFGGPIFLLGYSLGANIITKYLGEESLHGTLPKCIGGGAAMGNPLHIHSGSIAFPWNMLLAAGIKRTILQNYKTLQAFKEPSYHKTMKKALMVPTISQLDNTVSPYLIRNESVPPFATRIGYSGGGDEYWWDSSSHRYVAHVSVPLLKISAQDDFLVFGQFAKKLNHCLENPNVVVVKTRCGGHLGWQESPPSSDEGRGLLGGSGSWSDVAVADFIEALLQIREEDRQRRLLEKRVEANQVTRPAMPKIRSRL